MYMHTYKYTVYTHEKPLQHKRQREWRGWQERLKGSVLEAQPQGTESLGTSDVLKSLQAKRGKKWQFLSELLSNFSGTFLVLFFPYPWLYTNLLMLMLPCLFEDVSVRTKYSPGLICFTKRALEGFWGVLSANFGFVYFRESL